MTAYVLSLNEMRDELLRDYMLASGEDKVEILGKIMDLDEEIASVNN
ncbi:MAG: hypothetical protein QM368_01210 [Bacillota bacterium]|nr:hypothetical protein [Bacillota bacterium]HHU29818.1 hypothetical protein [Bacillota bacterium]